MMTLVYVFAIALVWVLIVGNPTIEVFGVGFAAGLGLVLLLRPAPFPVRWQRFPTQLIALVLYVLALFRDIFLSGLDVARRVLSPNMRLKPGIIAVPTQDTERSPLILALSANYITLTPGELVVEVEEDHMMYVHCLDIDASLAVADQAQSRRLRLLERVLGKDI